MKKMVIPILTLAWMVAAGMVMGIGTGQAAESNKEALAVPLGLPALPVPADNTMSPEKVELGTLLYFDKRFSKDNTVSCATCHKPEHGYAEPTSVSTGIGGQKGGRNAPTVINSAYMTSMFHDGREKDLEGQAGGPIENPIEMGHQIEAVAKTLNTIPEYRKMFMDAFGAPASKETITKAIAAFERTILSGNSPYDRYMAGDKSALSAEAVAGLNLFNGKALCATCHTPPLFTNGNFVNAGVGFDKPEPDVGRMTVTKSPEDKGKFRVPMLRDLKNTTPYFHDGSAQNLEEAVRFMAGGGRDNPNLFPIFKVMPKLSDTDIKQLVAFLESLSGEYPIVKEPELP